MTSQPAPPARRTTLGAGLVNVCSCGSSGSTLLARTLDRHPEIACGDELFLFCVPLLYDDYARFRRHRHLFRLIGVSGRPYHQGRAVFRHGKSYGLSRSRLWRAAARSRSINELAARVQDHVISRTGKRIWAEKTPRNIRVIGKFIAAFPDARVIHIVRDPRDVILSLRGRDKRLLHAAETWMASAASIAPHRERPNVLDVRYEDLCRGPEAALEQICRFLGVAFDPAHFATDEHASRSLGKFDGHASWALKPDEGFSTRSIGRYRTVDLDWSSLSRMRLTEEYAELLGTRRWRLGELARAYGYDMADEPAPAAGRRLRRLEAEWRVDPLRRALDAFLGIPPYMEMVEHEEESCDPPPPPAAGAAGEA